MHALANYLGIFMKTSSLPQSHLLVEDVKDSSQAVGDFR